MRQTKRHISPLADCYQNQQSFLKKHTQEIPLALTYDDVLLVPQITATMEAYRAGLEFSKPVITDGGTKNVGDIVKALAAGANAVVAGSQFAGTDEAPGSVVEVSGKRYKRYNASTSVGRLS